MSKVVRISSRHHQKLREMAKADKRALGAEVEELIDREAQHRRDEIALRERDAEPVAV